MNFMKTFYVQKFYTCKYKLYCNEVLIYTNSIFIQHRYKYIKHSILISIDKYFVKTYIAFSFFSR